MAGREHTLTCDCTEDGMPIMWCLTNSKIGEREVVAALRNTTTISSLPGRSCWPTRASPAKGLTAHRREGTVSATPGPQGRDLPQRQPRRSPSVDRVSQPDPQRATRPRKPRRQNSRRSIHPHRTTPPGPRHRDLAQLDHRRHQQTLTDRLQPLTPTSRNQPSRGNLVSHVVAHLVRAPGTPPATDTRLLCQIGAGRVWPGPLSQPSA